MGIIYYFTGAVFLLNVLSAKAQLAQGPNEQNNFTVSTINTNTLSGKAKPAKERDNAFTLYPNPSEGIFRVDIGNRPLAIEKTTVEVFTEEGKIVYSASYDQHEIDISKFPKGTYFIKVGDGSRKYTNKVIIQ